MTKFLLDFYKNWNNFTGKLWLYFFLLIYVKAMMTLLAFIVLEENNVLLSVDDLPNVVNVSFDRNMLSYQICQTVQRNKAATVLNSR